MVREPLHLQMMMAAILIRVAAIIPTFTRAAGPAAARTVALVAALVFNEARVSELLGAFAPGCIAPGWTPPNVSQGHDALPPWARQA